MTRTLSQSDRTVDCEEFRKLLLYCGRELCDQDIPHRDRVGQLIMLEFKRNWDEMAADLQVWPRMLILAKCTHHKAGLGQSRVLHSGHVDQPCTGSIPRGHRPLCVYYAGEERVGGPTHCILQS